MKKLSLVLAVFVSISSFATEIKESYDSSLGVTKAIISNPKHLSSNKLFATVGNSENGICRALGFEKALLNSIRFSDFNSSVLDDEHIRVHENGYVRSIVLESRSVSQIICLGKTYKYPNESVTIVKKPIYPDLNLGFTGMKQDYKIVTNSLDGICRVLGYDRAIPNSDYTRIYDTDWEGKSQERQLEETVIVDSSGNLLESVEKSYSISRIACARDL